MTDQAQVPQGLPQAPAAPQATGQTIDFDELKKRAETGGLVPDSTYDVRVASAKYQASKQGKPQIVADFEIVQGPYAGTKFRNWFTLSPDSPIALAIFFDQMAVLGVPRESFVGDVNTAMTQAATAIVGKYATATVTHGSYGGRTNNKISGLAPYGQGAPAAPSGLPPAPPTAPTPAAAPAPQPVAPQPQPVAPAPAPQPQPVAPQPTLPPVAPAPPAQPPATNAPPPPPF